MGDSLKDRVTSRPGPLTTRRGFIAAASLGAVSLYGLWAGLGAAPLSFESRGDVVDLAGMGGHEGHDAPQGPAPDQFRRLTEEFIAAHQQPDGGVLVEPDAAGQSMAGMTMPADSLDVFVLAQQFSFEPTLLRLRTGIPYRFKLMAVDAAHGASLQLGRAGHIVRLPAGVVVERQMTFTEAGEYLLYCTVYCGEGHQFMQGSIHVS